MKQPASLFNPTGVKSRDLFGMHRLREHARKVNEAREGTLGTTRGLIKNPDQYTKLMSPQMRQFAKGQILLQQGQAVQGTRAQFTRQQRLGAVNSYDTFLRLSPQEQGEWLNRATVSDMTLLLADTDADRRTYNLSRAADRIEMNKKGSQFAPMFGRQLIRLADDKSSPEAKKAVHRAVQIERAKK